MELSVASAEVFAGLAVNVAYGVLVLFYRRARAAIERRPPWLRQFVLGVLLALYLGLNVVLHIAPKHLSEAWSVLFFLISSGLLIYVFVRELWSFWRVGLVGADSSIAKGIGFGDSLSLCHSSLDFLGIGAHKLTKTGEPFREAVRRCDRPTKPIRFLLCHPDAGDLELWARKAGLNADAFKVNVRESLASLARLKHENARNIEVRFYSEVPIFRLMFIDGALCLASHYVFGEGDGSQLPQVHLRRAKRDNESLYYPMQQYFERTWDSATPWDFDVKALS